MTRNASASKRVQSECFQLLGKETIEAPTELWAWQLQEDEPKFELMLSWVARYVIQGS